MKPVTCLLSNPARWSCGKCNKSHTTESAAEQCCGSSPCLVGATCKRCGAGFSSTDSEAVGDWAKYHCCPTARLAALQAAVREVLAEAEVVPACDRHYLFGKLQAALNESERG